MTTLLQIYPIPLFMLVGLATLLMIQAPIKRLPLLGTIALTFWTGALTITFVIVLAGAVTGKVLLFLVWPLFLASAAVVIWKRKELKPSKPWRPTRGDIIQIALSIPLLGFMIYHIQLSMSHHMQYEICHFDSIGNFAMKAKLWYFTRDLIPSQLLDAEYLIFKRRYPPMVSMSETVWAYMMGRWDGIGLRYIFLAVWVGVGMMVYALVRMRGNILSGALAATIWFAIPVNVGFVWLGVLTGYGDVPLAMGFLAVSLALGLWVGLPKGREKWGAALLVALMLASTFWTKKEGLPFVMAAGLYLIAMRMPVRQLGATISICAFFLAVYMISVRGLPSHFEKDISLQLEGYELTYRLDRYIDLFYSELKKKYLWGERIWLILLGVLLFKIISLRWKTWFTREFYFLAFMLALYSVVTLLTIFGFEQNFKYLFTRLMLQVYPLFLVAIFAGFAPILPEGELADSDHAPSDPANTGDSGVKPSISPDQPAPSDETA